MKMKEFPLQSSILIAQILKDLVQIQDLQKPVPRFWPPIRMAIKDQRSKFAGNWQVAERLGKIGAWRRKCTNLTLSRITLAKIASYISAGLIAGCRKGHWSSKTGQKLVFSAWKKGFLKNPCYKRDFWPKTGLKRAKGLSVDGLDVFQEKFHSRFSRMLIPCNLEARYGVKQLSVKKGFQKIIVNSKPMDFIHESHKGLVSNSYKRYLWKDAVSFDHSLWNTFKTTKKQNATSFRFRHILR